MVFNRQENSISETILAQSVTGWQCRMNITVSSVSFDYHAITQNYDPETLAQRTLEMATDLLACGIDPERTVLFVQSSVPEHIELCWILNTVTPFGKSGTDDAVQRQI